MKQQLVKPVIQRNCGKVIPVIEVTLAGGKKIVLIDSRREKR